MSHKGVCVIVCAWSAFPSIHHGDTVLAGPRHRAHTIHPDDMSCLHSDGFIQTQKLAPRFDLCFKNTQQQQRQRPTEEVLVTWWTPVNASELVLC